MAYRLKCCSAHTVRYTLVAHGGHSMRLRLREWSQQDGQTQSLTIRGLDRSDLSTLMHHGRCKRVRPITAVFRLIGDFLTFCRWTAEIHMTGHRLGPVCRSVFQRPRHRADVSE